MDDKFLAPPPIQVPLLTGQYLSTPWSQWFSNQLYRRVGEANGIEVDATEVTFTPSGSLSAITVSGALIELDSSKQPLDATLTSLSALDSTVGFLTQTGTDVFAKRVITGASGNITVTYGNGSSDPIINLATANSNPGSFGNSAYTLLATVDSFGRITALSSAPIVLNSSQVAGVALLASENIFAQKQEINLNTTNPPASPTGSALCIYGADNAQVRAGVSAWGLAGMASYCGRYARGTAASPTAVLSGDCLVSYEGWGFDSANTEASPAAFMRFYAAENHGLTAHGSYVSIWTIPKTTIVPTEKLRIYDDGGVRIGGTYTSSPGAFALAVNGVVTGSNVSGSNTGDVTLATNHGLSLTNQVLALGTPSTCTSATANAVTTTTHTHAVTGFETSGSVAAHAALQTGVHGIAITAAKTFTCTNSLTLSGTDGSTLNIGTGGTLGTAAYTSASAYQQALNGTGYVKMAGTTVSYDNTTFATDSLVVHLAGTETITGNKLATGGFNFTTGSSSTATAYSFAAGDGAATDFWLRNSYGWIVSPTVTTLARSGDWVGTVTLLATSTTNKCLQSQAFDNATYWGISNVARATADTILAPDGTTTAESVLESATTSTHYTYQNTISVTSAADLCASVYLQGNGRQYIFLYILSDTGGFYAYFNLSGAGSVISGNKDGDGSAYTSAGIELVGGSWYRIWVSGKLASGKTAANMRIYFMNGSAPANYNYLGDITKGFYIWGAQLEQATAPTAYKVTTTGAASAVDYVVDANGKVTPTLLLKSGGALVWTGSGTLLPFNSGRGRFGGSAGFTEFEADGTMLAQGSATVWDDLFCPIVSGKVGASAAPTWASFTTNLSAYTFAVNDFIEIGPIEMKHNWREGSQIEIHVHWVTNGLNDATARGVKWQVFYAIANNEIAGGTVVFAEGNVSQATDTVIVANEADKTHKYSTVGTVTMTGFKIGSAVFLRLKRITATGTAPASNPFVAMVGIHYEIDTIGSRSISTK